MKTRLIRVGSSLGVRLSKRLLEQAGLEDEVEIRAVRGTIIITAAVTPRAGWAEAAAKYGSAEFLDAPSATTFEDKARRKQDGSS